MLIGRTFTDGLSPDSREPQKIWLPLTDLKSTILNSISDHMRGIYNWHGDKDPQAMFEHFRHKCSQAIRDSHAECVVPNLTAKHFFDQCSSKKVSKASGLDQWR